NSFQMINIDPYPQEIMEKAKGIHSSISLPPSLDSVFFIARMLRAVNDEMEVRRLIDEILLHRSLLRYSHENEETIYDRLFPHVYHRFSVSKLEGSPLSGNLHVFVQRMKDVHLRDILSTTAASQILHAYMALQEIFGRTIVATERKTGISSAIVTILDLEGLNLTEFLNPLSPNCKIAKMIVSLWAEYFSETLVRILIINSPGIISIMWQITRHIVDSRTANRLLFLSSVHQLKEYLDPSAIPVAYGGTWRDDSGFSHQPIYCTTVPKPVLPEDIADHDLVWRKHGIEKVPKPSQHSLKAKKQVDIRVCVPHSGHLVYSFTTSCSSPSSGEVIFSILSIENGKEVIVSPPFKIISITVPEQGSLPVIKGEYIIRFSNPSSSWFNSKVAISHQFVSPSEV
ncbi:hypothetical protein PMAYCL1PPCAC_29376, partial [Pristionchus mayeri]